MMKRLVIDSSVIVKWLHIENEENIKEADAILREASNGKSLLLVPELAKYEVLNALLHKELDTPALLACTHAFFTLPLQYYSLSESTAKRSMEMAHEHGITYYDAVFVALAQEESATLVTANPKHQRVQKMTRVIALKEYFSREK